MKFKPGDIVPATTLESVTGGPIELPDPNRLVHLQLRRFVDCPICNRMFHSRWLAIRRRPSTKNLALKRRLGS